VPGIDRQNSAGPDADARALEDLALVERAKAELPYRTKAFEELMRRHESLLYGVCLRLVNSRADAEDVCQEVMVKVFSAIQRFEARSSFKTWLMRIATNTCSTWRDRARRSREVAAVWAELKAQEADDPMPTASMDISSLLEQLKPREREIITLRYVADLDLKEIAEVCGLGLSATKMRLYRATERLQSLAGLTDDEDKSSGRGTRN